MQKESLQRLLKLVVITQEEELTCEQFYELMDVFAEMCINGEDAGQYYPLVEHHLNLCKGCREEYDGFLDCLKANQ